VVGAQAEEQKKSLADALGKKCKALLAVSNLLQPDQPARLKSTFEEVQYRFLARLP
jgi:hypothetical protein